MADQKITTNGSGATAKTEGNGHLNGGDLLSEATLEEALPGSSPSAPSLDDEAEIERLAQLSPLAFERAAAASAKRLGCRVGLLRKLVALARGDGGTAAFGQGRPIAFPVIIPSKEYVDGADLLSRMTEAIRRYVILEEEMARGVALWVIQAHAFGVDGSQPTLLIDEIDTVLSETSKSERSEELRGLINGGFDLAQAFVTRAVPVGDSWEVRQFSIWCPQILAGIGRVVETVADRAFHVRLKRKLRSESVARLRERDAGPLWELRSQAARWVNDNLDALARSDAEECAEINDRANDAWSLCFAIAERAGGKNWLSYAHRAAAVLSGEEPDDESNLPVMLLADIRDVFERRSFGQRRGESGNPDRISSKALVESLLQLDGRPWAEIGRARKPLTENMLGRLLKTFREPNLRSSTICFADDSQAKGYYRSRFADVFARWLPA